LGLRTAFGGVAWLPRSACFLLANDVTPGIDPPSRLSTASPWRRHQNRRWRIDSRY